MTRGNQREKDRAANLKAQAEANKGNSTIKQAESTAEIMRRKQAEAEAKKAAAAAQGESVEKKGPSQADKKRAAALEMAMTGRQATAKSVAAKRASK
mmetsp:Transcript_55995/g.141785  ORF Transcript_55995/g.141785 Transcript_55995/m.141785 type:complete len:97 (+) Transcript_55995:89-379(+)|eukprot:CAMPEP_0115251044 /NCGR_PEP_ID=MMETSP0270-20121206/43423_1 /TAXON_ID=71861 /ORGANISM="Scrippsiella trochoidea, Strain CCMP3099" /LENGTH=96 /DNA_ID=CAMNT_0002666445 /DNA_START=88 /DNA_END=378 /DNA_ORIENTATION=-